MLNYIFENVEIESTNRGEFIYGDLLYVALINNSFQSVKFICEKYLFENDDLKYFLSCSKNLKCIEIFNYFQEKINNV